ncbi:hypothetical protein AB9N12_18495 [Bacteroides sp. AN502(2024)]
MKQFEEYAAERYEMFPPSWLEVMDQYKSDAHPFQAVSKPWLHVE